MSHLDKTFAVLAKSRNDAATSLLVAALEATNHAVFLGAIRALVARRSTVGHSAALAKWHLLSADERQAFLPGKGRLGGALREFFLAPDHQHFLAACQAAQLLGEFEVLPTLLTLAEHADPQRSDAAVAVALALVAQLETMTHADREVRDRQNTDLIRGSVLECLERSIERFRQHNRRELVEAFISLAGPDNKSLRAMLDGPHHPCFAAAVEVLTQSPNQPVLSLIAALLVVADVPQVVRSIAGKRTDEPFARTLLGAPYDVADALTAKALARIKNLAALEPAHFDCRRWSTEQLLAAVKLAAATGLPDDKKFDLYKSVLEGGSAAARLQACQALVPIKGQQANDLAVRALADQDPDVQVAAVEQIRARHIPGSLAKLIDLVASPHAAVQAAARKALPEFTVEGILAQFDVLDESQRQSTATIAARIDPTAVQRLKQELESGLARRRLRAIELAVLMRLAPPLADMLVERLADEDHLVRAAAAAALADCTSHDVRDALVASLEDRSTAVQKAAQKSLDKLALATTR